MLADVARAFVGAGSLTEKQGAVLVASAGAMFSVTAIAHAAVVDASDFQFLTYRGASTALAMVGLVVVRRSSRPVDFGGLTPTVWLAGSLLAGTSMLYILALSRTTAATTLILIAAAPVVAAVIGAVWLGERVEATTAAAIGITSVGVLITAGAGLAVGTTSGLVLAGCLPVAVGIYSVLMRTAASVDPVVPTLISGMMLGVASAGVALTQGSLVVSWRDLAMASVSGGLALGVGLPMFNLGHRSVPAAKIPLLLMTEVVLAPLWVWIWPGEAPNGATLLGGAVILGSVAWLATMSRTVPVSAPSSAAADIPAPVARWGS